MIVAIYLYGNVVLITMSKLYKIILKHFYE